MLNSTRSTKHEQKCIITHGTMGNLDPKQPSVKRKPFSSILNHHFVYKMELILPQELYDIIKDKITELPVPSYRRVIMPLKALLEGEFFSEHIKKGNVLMLSEGRIGVDNVYSLREGILTLHLDKESYEKTGIVGKPEGVKGNRGTKPRWIVEINLRLPSMLHGKKGFDRIVYAFKQVLTTPVTWLFSDLSTTILTPDPLAVHFPTMVDAPAEISQNIHINMPSLKPPSEVNPLYGDDFEDFAVDIHEWLSLISLESPRIKPEDKIDTLLCQYVTPGELTSNIKLVRITWRGFWSSSWTHKVFVHTLLSAGGQAWFACSILGFAQDWNDECKGCTILKIPDAPNEYVLWEVA